MKKNNDVYTVIIVYLSGIADDMAEIRTIGVYKKYDIAVEAAKNTLKMERDSMLEDDYDVDIVNYENEWWVYESGEIYAIVVINKTTIK